MCPTCLRLLASWVIRGSRLSQGETGGVSGRTLRMLTVIDEYTRQCLAIEVARRLRHDDVLDILAVLFARHGPPDHIRSDNGSEFTAIAVRDWLPPQPLTRDPIAIPVEAVRIA
jgi:transposase InsO family protein